MWKVWSLNPYCPTRFVMGFSTHCYKSRCMLTDIVNNHMWEKNKNTAWMSSQYNCPCTWPLAQKRLFRVSFKLNAIESAEKKLKGADSCAFPISAERVWVWWVQNSWILLESTSNTQAVASTNFLALFMAFNLNETSNEIFCATELQH